MNYIILSNLMEHPQCMFICTFFWQVFLFASAIFVIVILVWRSFTAHAHTHTHACMRIPAHTGTHTHTHMCICHKSATSSKPLMGFQGYTERDLDNGLDGRGRKNFWGAAFERGGGGEGKCIISPLRHRRYIWKNGRCSGCKNSRLLCLCSQLWIFFSLLASVGHCLSFILWNKLNIMDIAYYFV